MSRVLARFLPGCSPGPEASRPSYNRAEGARAQSLRAQAASLSPWAVSAATGERFPGPFVLPGLRQTGRRGDSRVDHLLFIRELATKVVYGIGRALYLLQPAAMSAFEIVVQVSSTLMAAAAVT